MSEKSCENCMLYRRGEFLANENNLGCLRSGMDECPKCGSKNLTKIDRMNGYLSYSRIHQDTRLNSAKMAEIAERVSM